MRRFVIAIVLLISIAGFSISNYFLVDGKIDSIIALMEEDRRQTIQTGKTDEKRTDSITEKWKENETYLISMLTHHELEDFEIGIMCLPDYMKQGLTEEYIKTLNECINRLYHIKETEKVNTKNIF